MVEKRKAADNVSSTEAASKGSKLENKSSSSGAANGASKRIKAHGVQKGAVQSFFAPRKSSAKSDSKPKDEKPKVQIKTENPESSEIKPKPLDDDKDSQNGKIFENTDKKDKVHVATEQKAQKQSPQSSMDIEEDGGEEEKSATKGEGSNGIYIKPEPGIEKATTVKAESTIKNFPKVEIRAPVKPSIKDEKVAPPTPKKIINRASMLKREKSSFQEELEEMEARVPEAKAAKELWSRNPIPDFDPEKDPLIFQQMEIDEYVDISSNSLAVRLYGVTQNGNSVTCFVHGFYPYFYVPAPPQFDEDRIPELIKVLNAQIASENRARGERSAVVNITIVMKESIYGYHGGKKLPFFKIEMRGPSLISIGRSVFTEKGVDVPGVGHYVSQAFESNIEYTLRFMIDHKVVGANWVELPAGKYSKRLNTTSRAQIEVQVYHKDLISHDPATQEWSHVAPLRILSFDIECAGRKGIFPEPKVDPVIQIANMVTIHGSNKPFIRNIFTLNTCAPIIGSQILSYSTEQELLRGWKEFLLMVDPDIVIGYNTTNFDFPYLIERAEALGVNDFPYLGRLSHVKSVLKESRFSSKAYGTREDKVLNMEGRVQFDILQAMRRDYKLRSFSLNAVSAHFLGEQKEDVPHSIITDLQNGTDETRRRLAVYCLKDAYLPQRLADKLMLLVNYMEMARVTGVPFNYLLSRGQQIKVVSQLYRKAIEQDLVIPVMERGAAGGSDEQYEGATVIEPKRGFYNVPIATLDFASLYPSIMMAHNLCYTTLLTKQIAEQLKLVKEVDYEVTPAGDMFVKAERRKGLLPQVLQELLSARKKAKADMKKETDPFKVQVLNGRQLALKISANSVYGFTGATVGRLPCLQISASVTAYGREMIEATKKTVENHYCKANGYEHDAEVIYGDTDSVMVRFGTPILEESMKLGTEAAGFVSNIFVKPIKLEFEKVYFPYLLINKKRYAGLYWTRPEKYDKLDTKGLETVRRDNCPLVPTVVETCLRKMLIDNDVDGAVKYAKETIANLLQNKVDLSQLIITKQLSRTDYSNKQAHVELAERMRRRDAGSAPQLGDRVPYVIIKAARGTPAYERAEDPIYVLENNIPIDTHHYLSNQLTNPLQRIFEPILGNKIESLFAGDHTRSIQMNAPTKGGLMNFVVKTKTCLGCKTPLPKASQDQPVCKHCKPKLPQIYLRNKDTMNAFESQFAKLWTQCQRCQGSLHNDVICGNRDCPIFYMRKKVQKDCNEQAQVMERFDCSW